MVHISLVSTDSAGLPDIDSLNVVGPGVAAGSCLDYAPGQGVSYTAPTFQDASVHDPSVIRTNNVYYVFGSHLAAAKTPNLMSWTQVAGDGVNASNPLFDDVVTELSDAFDWSTVVGLWAADVIQLESTGKYLMYYNSCEGSSPLSAMGIASSDSIEGPYTDEGVFLYSGGSGYNASVLPNAIDPDTFYDKDGVMRMVYGSYSGGIYMMDMNPATGFPMTADDYGTHLLGGNHIQIEGPYIQYSPQTDYYYLFTSYGGLAAGDGYNIRVARATTPHGPYTDHAGVDQATVTSAPFDYSGVKMMGDHVWANTGGSHGYVSPGHNSSYYEAATDTYFLIFHARFPLTGNFHQIRVHQMYMTIDGWPVAAPLRYAPRSNSSGVEPTATDYIGLSEIPGAYQFLNHGRDISGTIKESVGATLSSDGAISGSVSGIWTFAGNNAFVVNLSGTDFRGVVSRQYNDYSNQFQVTFAGVSAAGETLWAIRTGN
ncbi:MAG: glycoside hydrolase family 43 protein [Deltaproteobacteria bacterium]|nr:glycoside hydrolase family 43 protein [Deltaproteobacteria bacterium]MBN2672790.1 glycoside hydrolase family 43 protein [Deltaproteobacteria bacterium]